MNDEDKKIVEIKGKKIPKKLLAIIIRRVEAMPPNIKLVVLGEILTKEDIIKEITSKSLGLIGQEILEMEIDYYQDLIKD